MKKYLFMAVAAIAALSSCSSDNEVFDNEVKKESTFTATMEGFGSTRTTFDSENKCAAWEVGDEIVIYATSFTSYGSETALYTAQSAGTTTTFKPKTEGEEVHNAQSYLLAFFPAKLMDMETKQNALPATITAEYGKFNMPMFYRGNGTNLEFKNIGGVLAINVNNEQLNQVSSIKVSSSNCATSGKFIIQSNGVNIALDEPNKTENTVTVTYTEPVATDATGKVFYVAIPAQTYKNLKIEISNGTNTKSMTTKKDVDIVVERSKIYNITFNATTGTATTKGGVIVNWVQLWDGGPKFAEYNIGVTNGLSTSYGNYYSWGGFENNNNEDYNTKESGLIGQDDTATKLWGDEWRMPTAVEFQELVNGENCNCTWTDDYNGVKGILCTGKAGTAYENNSVFFPAAGYFSGTLYSTGTDCSYWSSTPHFALKNYNSALKLVPSVQEILEKNGASVRAVFKDPDPVIGTAKATIGGSEVDVNWVQLWKNGPKFAEYNVGATSATGYGGYYCWGKSIDKDSKGEYKYGTYALTGSDDTATNLWGNNWRMPTQVELNGLLSNCEVKWTTVSGVNGRLFTGKGDYSSNSVFLPAAGNFLSGNVYHQGSGGYYWSSSGSSAYLDFNSDGQHVYYNNYRLYGYSVRAVLAE